MRFEVENVSYNSKFNAPCLAVSKTIYSDIVNSNTLNLFQDFFSLLLNVWRIYYQPTNIYDKKEYWYLQNTWISELTPKKATKSNLMLVYCFKTKTKSLNF